MAKKKPKVEISESYVQCKIIEWKRIMEEWYPALRWLHAVPNGGYALNPISAARMKREGVEPGVHDLFWPYKNRDGFSGLYIEVKRPGRVKTKRQGMSKEQIEFGRYVSEQGFKWVVTDSIVDGIEAIKDFGGIE